MDAYSVANEIVMAMEDEGFHVDESQRPIITQIVSDKVVALVNRVQADSDKIHEAKEVFENLDVDKGKY